MKGFTGSTLTIPVVLQKKKKKKTSLFGPYVCTEYFHLKSVKRVITNKASLCSFYDHIYHIHVLLCSYLEQRIAVLTFSNMTVDHEFNNFCFQMYQYKA